MGFRETSAASHDKLEKGSVQDRIYNYLDRCETDGATCAEIEAALSLPHETVSGQLRPLEKKGVIICTARKRKNPRTKREAHIYVTTIFHRDIMGVAAAYRGKLKKAVDKAITDLRAFRNTTNDKVAKVRINGIIDDLTDALD